MLYLVFHEVAVSFKLKLAISITAFIFLFISLPAQANPVNSLTIKNESSAELIQHPVQVGRLFLQGEIPQFPKAVFDNVPMTTQADIKQRWPDGSVKHAVVSFVAPRLQPNVLHNVSFTNQSSGNNTTLDTSVLLDTGFDAEIVIKQGTKTKRASAREMLTNGDFSLWTQGSVVTTFILADHSMERKYDLGFDELRSVRPIYHVAFWPTTGDIRVRYIGENINTETLQNLAYSFDLTLNGSNKYSLTTAKTHHYGSRWTQTFWNNPQEQKVSIDHNLAYLKETRFFANYDTSLTIPELQLDNWYQTFLSRDNELYGSGLWQVAMSTTGGRSDLGIHPAWVSAWLYSGDWRLFEVSAKQADLAANWSAHSREGDSSKTYLREGNTQALGRPVSVNARPSLWLYDHRNLDITHPDDAVIRHNTNDIGWRYWGREDAWSDDIAHRVNPYSALYALTGDYWYLEQLQLWAATSAMEHTSNAIRGPNNMAGIHSEIRGEGRGFRERVHALLLTPDNTPEKQYFTDITYDTIALWAGERSIALSELQDHPAYQYGLDNPVAVSPSQFWQPNVAVNSSSTPHLFTDGMLDVKAGGAPWMYSLFRASVGEAAQMGLPTQPLVDWSDKLLTSLFASPVSKHAVGAYFIAVQSSDEHYFTWPEIAERIPVLEQLIAGGEGIAANTRVTNVNHGYPTLAYASSTYLNSGEQQQAVHQWLKQNYYSPQINNFANNPQWAILARTQNSPKPLAGLTPVMPSPAVRSNPPGGAGGSVSTGGSSSDDPIPTFEPPEHPVTIAASNDVGGAYIYLDFDESTTNSASNLVAETEGTVTYREGRFGSAIYFDGTSYLNLPDYEISPPYTVSMWVKSEQASRSWPGETFVLADGSRSGACLSTPAIRYNSNFELAVKTVAACGSEYQGKVEGFAFGYWQHITLVVEPESTSLYVNGENVGATIGIQNASTTPQPNCLFIGAEQSGDCHSPGKFYRGLMDEFRVYRRALNPSEVSRIYRVDPNKAGDSELGAESDITDGLISRIDFESDVVDSVGNSVSGNAPAIVTGKYGSAGEFNGQDSYLSVEGLHIAPNYSVSLWLQPSGTPSWPNPEFGIIDGGQSGACQFIPYIGYRVPDAFYWNGNTTQSHIVAATGDCSNPMFRSGSLLELGSWHHVAIVTFSNARQIYINGHIAEDMATRVSASDNQCVFIGAKQIGNCTSPTSFFSGLIDEVRIYNKALTAEEVTTLASLNEVAY
ncbi:LamG domain-containing protein [Alteromonadaceae bacterium M269]|nr:LamG domain-containing protein [Alteromonadaceae bacterium M269]